MAGNGGKVVINVATGLEDTERVTVAFLVSGAAAEQGRQVAMFLTKEAVRLAVPEFADAVACEGCPPLSRLFQQYAENGGELLVCPICAKARKLDESDLVARLRARRPRPHAAGRVRQARSVSDYDFVGTFERTTSTSTNRRSRSDGRPRRSNKSPELFGSDAAQARSG